MFGYIRFDRNELKLKEYHLLRSYYCGLCQRLGKVAPILKLKLSYDMTFLALCIACCTDESASFKKKWCMNHPLHKTQYAFSPSIELAADLSILLAVFKLYDNAADGEKVRAYLGNTLLKHAYQNAKKRHANLHASIQEQLQLFYEAEKNTKDAEELAVLFGNVILHIIPHLNIPDKYVPVLAQIGSNLGQWIYLADAADDKEEDFKKGRFNPLTEPASFYALGQSYRLAQAKAAAALLPNNHIKPIIENFLTHGMYAQQMKYFSEKEENHGN